MSAKFRPDKHSYFRIDQPRTTNIDFTLTPNFEKKRVYAEASLTFDHGGLVSLDTRELEIHSVLDKDGNAIPFTVADQEKILGSRLDIEVPAGNPQVTIKYTICDASGLQWLTPEQTAGKRHPFLFSQGECIHTRSYLPCQDTPGVRVTFRARLYIPSELRGLMAAMFVSREECADLAVETWEMTHPIPSYLIAFAIGDVVSRDLSDRVRIWAEPELIEAAANEFEDLPAIVATAEGLFGPYPWERYDALFMPTAFPFGGMENQGLTFFSPSIVAGDKSMVSVAAHELAHSWFGNLVTNATWEDFWLNEGWTMWAENRLVEDVFGIDAANLGRAIMDGEVEKDIERFVENGTPELTQLKWNLTGIDPDDAFSRVPYQKGVRFLETLEAAAGREAFDAFARQYIHAFGFSTITTREFIEFLREKLPGTFEKVLGWEWVYEPGMPKSALPLVSPLITEVRDYATRREIPSAETVGTWRPIQIGLYLEHFPRPATEDELDMLDRRLKLSDTQNADIRCNWLLLCIESDDEENLSQIKAFLKSIGRMKYIRPLYKALARNHLFAAWAQNVYQELRASYHPIAQQAIERAFEEAART